MTIRVFVVDDHVIVRTGMCMIMRDEAGVEIVGHAENGEDALPQLRKVRPDVLVCDMHLPGISGLEVTERVVRGGYGTRVIAVSAQHEGPLPRRAMAAGASPRCICWALSMTDPAARAAAMSSSGGRSS